MAAAQEFWDHHHAIAEDPLFWMAHPLCRAAVNRRVTGSPHVWPLDAFVLAFGRNFPRGVSLGCGIGNLERAARRLGLCEEILGIDVSAMSLDVARERAAREGITGLTYRPGDLDRLRLPESSCDLVFLHQSLHHVIAIERLLDCAARALANGGLLYLDEWTGPSRFEWNSQRLARVCELFEEIPGSWRKWPRLKAPIEAEDPSEAVRSSAILRTLPLYFDVLIERPYGGHLVSVLLSQMKGEARSDPAFEGTLSRWLALEDEDLRRDPSASYYVALVARPRRGMASIPARLLGLGRQAQLSLFGVAADSARLAAHGLVI